MHSFTFRVGLVLLLVLQCLASTGCSGMTTGRLPGDDPSAERPVIKVGRQAKVYTVTGKVYEGEVTQVSETQITLGKPSNHGFAETVIPASEIDWVEFEHVSETERKIVTPVAIVVAAAFFLFIGALIAWSNTDWDHG